jgi:hypothetical protein
MDEQQTTDHRAPVLVATFAIVLLLWVFFDLLRP